MTNRTKNLQLMAIGLFVLAVGYLMPSGLGKAQQASLFPDVAEGYEHQTAIESLKEWGIIDGNPDGSFNPRGVVNRAELSKFIAEGRGITPNTNIYKNCFPDVNEEWFAKYVCYAKTQGWIDGYPDGFFRPGNEVLNIEAVKMLLNSREVSTDEDYDSSFFATVDRGQWYRRFVVTAEKLNLIENFRPGDAFLRENVSEVLFRLIATEELEEAIFDESTTNTRLQSLLGSKAPTTIANLKQRLVAEKTPTPTNTSVSSNGSTSQPADQSSGGTLALDNLRVSRTECTSPCPVMFSIDEITDSSSSNPFAETGVYWDYDDDQADENYGLYERGADYFLAGRQAGTGASRETDTNTPLGMHTYFCESGTCTFYPGVSLRNDNGDWVTAWSTITVEAEEETFSPQNTVCYSANGDFTDCPSGATQVTSNILPDEDEWTSDTRYLLRRGQLFRGPDSDDVCIENDHDNIHVSSFGPGATKAEIDGNFNLGVDSNCLDFTMNDAQFAAYSNPMLMTNITLTDLRLPVIQLGMVFENLTFHDLDMDYENESGGGVIIYSSGNYCSNNAGLTCSNIPLPKNIYLSSLEIIGSRNTPPGLNFGMMNSACTSFAGVIDTTMQVSIEHNLRYECSSRTTVMHSDINGDHLGQVVDGELIRERGQKNAITYRPDGNYEADMLDSFRRSTDDGAGGHAYANIYESRYSAVKNVYLGTPASINNAARISIAPTVRSYPEVTRYSVVSGNASDMSGGSGDGSPNRDVNFAGWGLVCYDDNSWETANGCADNLQGGVPDHGFQASQTIAAPTVPSSPGSY